MPLWFDLRVNDQQVGYFYARRAKGFPEPDSIGSYEMRIDDWRGDTEHRYGDGPWVLVHKAFTAYLERDGEAA